MRAGDQWQDNGLVFATEFGTPVDPRNILRTIQIAAQKAGMADIGVHTLRHIAAVAWLEAGYTSRPWPICWDTARSRSPETSTGTPPIHGAGSS